MFGRSRLIRVLANFAAIAIALILPGFSIVNPWLGSVVLDLLAAASTAQVHRAVLHTGEEVVVKVQRLDIIPQVRADLGVMHEIAGALQKRHVVGDPHSVARLP